MIRQAKVRLVPLNIKSGKELDAYENQAKEHASSNPAQKSQHHCVMGLGDAVQSIELELNIGSLWLGCLSQVSCGRSVGIVKGDLRSGID